MAKRASKVIGSHTGLLFLKQACQSAQKVLDVGCGEGSRLHTLLPGKKSGFGVDASKYAIAQAQKQYPQSEFKVSGINIPYPDNSFDLVYSTFVLEHTDNPEILLQEMIRVCSKFGLVVVLCPNFGAPNRRSPVSSQQPVSKLFTGFVKDITYLWNPPTHLQWQKVNPSLKYSRPDDDTTVEPYLGDLLSYMSNRDMVVKKYSSMWDLDDSGTNIRKWLFRILGSLRLYPFKYWGPQIFVAFQKMS